MVSGPVNKKPVVKSAGEVCTTDRAKKLGILNDQGKFIGIYDDLQTYDPEKDKVNNPVGKLCRMENDDTAVPLCTVQHGPGFIRDVTSKTPSCITFDCPPGFERVGKFCKKEPVLVDARIDKRSQCSERWYDWFTIPNYHLGNTLYEEAVGKCYTPCPPGHVPNYARDPVDNMRIDFVSSDKPTECIPREKYFMGKYEEGSEFCPIAWIHRMNASIPNVEAKVKKMMADVKNQSDGRVTQWFEEQEKSENVMRIAKTVNYLSSTQIENIEPPKEAMNLACSTLHTKDRLKEGYDMCKTLLRDEYLVSLDPDVSEDAKKKTMMKQACNAVFCNDRSNALEVIDEEPMCFPRPKKLNEDEEVGPPMYDKQYRFFLRTLRDFIFIVITPVMIMSIYLFGTRFVWPKIVKPLWRAIKTFITGRRYAADEYVEQALDMKAALRREMRKNIRVPAK
jgi:hypothetical protein